MENFLTSDAASVRQKTPPWKGWILLSTPLILASGLVLIYYPTFQWFWWRWFRTESYYSHGLLIPGISAFLIWRKRRQLRELPIHSDPMGLVILIGGLLMHLSSAWMRVHFTSGISLLVVLVGLNWYLLGRKVTQAIWFPLFFLIFMVPMPMDLIAWITFKLKIWVATLGTSLVNLLGTTAIREGSVVLLSNTVVTIDAACSGLKSLITFLAMGSLYAYIVDNASLRRWLFILLCVPIAIVANLVRVVLILIIANRYGAEIITNDLLHKGFGLMVFAIGLVCFFLLAKQLKLEIPLTEGGDRGKTRKNSTPYLLTPSLPRLFTARRFLPVGIASLLLGTVGVMTFGAYAELMDTGIRYTFRFPKVIGNWRVVRDEYAQNPEASKRVFKILETEDTIYWKYQDVSGNSVDLVIVYSPHNRKVAHPPDICFQGGGWQQQLKETLPAPYGRAWGLNQVNRLILDRGGAKQIALYWYQSGGQQTDSYLKQQVTYLLNSMLRRNRGVALIRLTAYADTADQISAKTQSLEVFAEQVVPLVAQVIP